MNQAMAERARTARIANASSMACAALVLVHATRVLAGWLLGLPQLIQPSAILGTMQSTTAFTFALLGFALLFDRSPRLTRGLAVIIGSIGLVALAQYFTAATVGIEGLLGDPVSTAEASAPRRMAAVSALAFLLFGAALYLNTLRTRAYPLLVHCLTGTAGALGIAILVTHTFHDPGHATIFDRVSNATAISTILVASALSLKAALVSFDDRFQTITWSATGVGSLGIALTIFAWAWGLSEEAEQFRKAVRFDASRYAHALASTVESDIDDLKITTRFFNSSQSVEENEFRTFVAPFVKRHRAFTTIAWIPHEGGAEGLSAPAVEKLGVPRARSSVDYASDPPRRDAMERAAKTARPASTDILRSDARPAPTPGEPDFAILVPVFERARDRGEDAPDNGAVLGFIVGGVEVSNLLRTAFRGLGPEDLEVDFRPRDGASEDDAWQFRADTDHAPVNALDARVIQGLAQTESIKIADRDWTLKFTPTRPYLQRTGSWFPAGALTGGVIFSLLAAGYILALQRRNLRVEQIVSERTREIGDLNRELESRVAERTRELEQAKRFAESVTESSSSIVYVVEHFSGYCVFHNRNLARFLEGTEESRMLGGSWASTRVHPDDIPFVARRRRELLKSPEGTTVDFEVRMRHVSGEYRWVWLHERILSRGPDGCQVIGTGHDISERRRAEEALRISEERFRELSVSSPIGIFQTDVHGEVRYANPQWRRLAGISPEEDLELAWAHAVHPADTERITAAWNEAVAREGEFTAELRIVRPDGRELWVHRRAAPIKTDDGVLVGYVGTEEDITTRKAAEEELLAAASSKSQFLANMSHEIRTPLTSIIGYTEALIAEGFTEVERQRILGVVLRNSKHLLGVINDILDLSKIQSGRLETEVLSVRLGELINDARNLMELKAREKDLQLTFEALTPLPRTILTDPTRLKQILINLIGNALKFTEEGTVHVGISCNMEDESLTFAVRDTGPGLTPQQTSRLFKAFSQADTSTTRQFGGTGLGLIISYELATKLGGSITLESAPGVGSTFSASVSTGPIARDDLTQSWEFFESENRAAHYAPIPVLGGHVLLVEDGLDNQELVSLLLSRAGLAVTVAENGLEACKKIHEREFDLVLMDMQMPVMDGYTATRTLREMGYRGPIVALTANIMTSELERCREAGCDMHLGKPFRRDHFYEMLTRILGTPPPIESDAPMRDDDTQPILPEIDPDPELISLVIRFIERLPGRIEEIEAAIRAKDWAEVRQLTHKLRGAAFFYPVLADSTTRVEKIAIGRAAGNAGTIEEFEAGLEELRGLRDRIVRGQAELEAQLHGGTAPRES